MSRRANPFSPVAVIGMLLVGAAAFLLLLYALGQGWTGDEEERDGGSHAAANGLNGYSGLVQLLQDSGRPALLMRNPSQLNDYNLTILTPPLWSDSEEIDQIVENRLNASSGPTIIILPKWQAFTAQQQEGVEIEEGWVQLFGTSSPEWFAELAIGDGAELGIGETGSWQGLGRSGDLPNAEQVQALVSASDGAFTPLITDSEGDILAAEVILEKSEDEYLEDWPVIVVFEPDLFNNYGLADRDRAAVAVQIIDWAADQAELPIAFDLTLNGFGRTENLLTLAFSPPFLAATLCLLLAAIVIGWRGLRRFGPALVEAPTMARGKEQLARNGASLLARVKRWHLLKSPYENMIARRVTAALGLRVHDLDTREAAIDAALSRRGHDGPPFSHLAADLRQAEKPRDIIRAAQRLRTFERTLTQ